jgi:valyl-tRNA synthetase
MNALPPSYALVYYDLHIRRQKRCQDCHKAQLPVIIMLSGNRRISENGVKYKGLSVNQVRAIIVQDLTASGVLEKTEKITQEVGVCDRCKAQANR